MKIKIGGVPEHFNLPWHLAIEEGVFEDIQFLWEDVPEGTGAMSRKLDAGELDMALLLTEGAVNAIDKGGNFKIYDHYVKSPLIWGIHVANDSSFEEIDDIKNQRYAISRYGSGSHLMAFVDADIRGWKTDKLKFEVINNLSGAIEALTNGRADTFFWEKFTTKPLVDEGTFRRVGERPTPWPCFVLAINQGFYEENAEAIAGFWHRMKIFLNQFSQLPDLISMVAERYNQKEEDVKDWRAITEWNTATERISPTSLTSPLDYLRKLDLLETEKPNQEYVF